ncbi:hypothetical protein AB7942_03240 [Neobacillus sp. BF23-41]|uniref:hypothetical protein n=1 Tax=Neobacillus sp. BF23-41 TaxID=3240280 RepID=UPI0034E424A0
MGHKPDFRTISDFRKDHLELLPGLFKQVVQIAMKLGYASHGHVIYIKFEFGIIKINMAQYTVYSNGLADIWLD